MQARVRQTPLHTLSSSLNENVLSLLGATSFEALGPSSQNIWRLLKLLLWKLLGGGVGWKRSDLWLCLCILKSPVSTTRKSAKNA